MTELEGDEFYVTVAQAVPYVNYVAKAYEIVKGMYEFGKESETDKAIRHLTERIAIVEYIVAELDDRLSDLELKVAQGDNRDRFRTIRENQHEFFESARRLTRHPEDAADIAANTLDRLRTMFEDEDLWMWDDAIRKPDEAAPNWRPAAPHFKGMPLATFAVGTMLWAFAAQAAVAAGGALSAYAASADELLQWVSTRTDFVPYATPPVSIVEKFRAAIRVEVATSTRYVTPAGYCQYAFIAVSDIDRSRKSIRDVDIYHGAAPAAMCMDNPRIADGDEALLEDETPAIQTLQLLEDAIARIRLRGTLADPFVGQFPNWTAHRLTLFAIEPSGILRRFELSTTTALTEAPTVTAVGNIVGTGWQNFVDVQGTYGTVLYAFSGNGAVDWYRQDNVAAGPGGWAGPKRVHPPQGFFPFGYSKTTYINGGGGDFYVAMERADRLQFKRWLSRVVHGDPRDGNGTLSDGAQVAPIRFGYRALFGGGRGVIYAIDEAGDLYWLKHSPFLKTFEEPVKIGNGWNGFARVFAFEHGFIVGQYPNGVMLLYQFTQWQWGPQGGAPVWHGPVTVPGTYWKGFQHLIPMVGDAPPIVR